VLDHVTIHNSQSYYAGGAIRDVNGTTIVIDSLIENNQSQYGGGIDSGGTLTLINTLVQNNHATVHEGGGLDVGGTVVISNSQIIGNSANGDSNGGGGGLNITASGRVSISGSQLKSNQTPTQTTAATGGAIRNFGALTISQSTLNGNSANDGGGIYNEGTSTVTLNNVVVSGNSGYDGGGGIYNNGDSTLTLNNVTISGNSGGGGGGLFNYATAIVNNSTLSGNSASAGGGLYNLGAATLINTTFSGNSATNQGGGLYNYFDARLLNVTLSNNSASTGGALFMEIGYTTTMTNTIMAYSSAGGNCSGTLTTAKFSLSSDNSCALTGLINGHNPNGLDPLLTALGNYGGPTLVHMLKLGSPAIAGVVGNDAPAIDQRGQPRPGSDGSYDIGAVERQPDDSSLAPRVYLPLVWR
jgi:predicted outer membrane repeat protein